MDKKVIGANYILEVSWGCPSEKYPLNGLFQFDQAKALHNIGEKTVFLALDMRSFRRLRKWGYNRFEKAGIPVVVYNFPWGPFSPRLKYKAQDFSFKRAIRRIEKEFGTPRCIHVHCCQQVISVTDYCESRNIPYVVTEHITPLNEGDDIEKRKEKALKGARTVIAVSNALARDVKKNYGADSVVIPNIVDLSEFKYSDLRQRQQNSETQRTNTRTFEFLSAASANHGKGFDILVRAYAKLIAELEDNSTELSKENISNTKTHLTIMGDGPELPIIRNMASELGILDNITFTGSYVRKEFADNLSHSDCFVLPSRSETFGIVYIEALATGTPVIATKCGGPEDFVDDTNGILIPVDDVDALAEAMKGMVRDSMSTNRRFSGDHMKQVSESCKEKFSPEAVAKEVAGKLG
ncbi:glycosyltransferase [Butyrivibrio sp. VCB2006]|uniref:glycosyltransferase n=1 Tax=Butyrivibrio sp. VCB2006 TaxID=1280679 RepID=UPI0003FF7927|nr:glycosyltransferase [Butyrivibrio sp. VCB2006]